MPLIRFYAKKSLKKEMEYNYVDSRWMEGL